MPIRKVRILFIWFFYETAIVSYFQLFVNFYSYDRRLKAEIIAHQDARRKIECLTMEASCKDEEVYALNVAHHYFS